MRESVGPGACCELFSHTEALELKLVRGEQRAKLRKKFRCERGRKTCSQRAKGAALQTCEIMGKVKTFSDA